MKRPLFSCVIPVKGPRPYFDEALRSLLSQGMGDDLEIIVQDADVRSGGVGESGVGELNHEIHERHENGRGVRGQELADNDGDLEVVRWFCEADKGQSDALNKGFAKAKGDWFFWLNADDVLLPGALKKILDRINKIDGINWIAGNQLLIDDAGKVLKCSVGNGWHDWLYRHAVPHVYGPSSFFRRELLERVGGLDVSLKYCMDWDLWIKFMKAGARFERIGDYLWAQRQWSGSKTQREKSEEEESAQWAEISRMLSNNKVDVSCSGSMMMRMWRFFNGNVTRQVVDGLRFKGRHYSEVCE